MLNTGIQWRNGENNEGQTATAQTIGNPYSDAYILARKSDEKEVDVKEDH